MPGYMPCDVLGDVLGDVPGDMLGDMPVDFLLPLASHQTSD